jgi:hypothetical protein
MADMAMAATIKAWHALNAEDRMTVLRSDPEAIDLAWNGADDATRKRFTANRRRELGAAMVPDLEPIPTNGVDVARQARAMRYADPRDSVVRNLADEFKGLAPYLPRGMLPRGVD